MAGGPISKSQGGVMPPSRGGSATVYTPAGSGSRPTPSRFPIKTSAPSNPHSLDGKMPPGALK
jgi:hypothetical protein